MAAKARTDIDWDAMLPDWRAGKVTVSALARQYGCSRRAIEKHWEKHAEHRDLNGKIQAEAEAKIAASMVAPEKVAAKVASERQIVAANAQAVADVLLSHRDDIRRHRAVATGLLAELESQVADPELFEQLGELMASPDGRGTDKLNDMYRKVIALPGKVDASRKLAETLKVLIALEREAFNVQPGGEDPLKKLGEQFAKTASESWKLAINALD